MDEILLAEDDRFVRKGFRALLTAAGFSVRTANNGSETLKAFHERRPDLLLLDVMMPGMDGYEVCRKIRAEDTALPIVFLTALDADQDELKGLAAGGDTWICKTASREVILARITTALRRGRKAEDSSSDFPFARAIVNPLTATVRSGKDSARLSLREVELLRYFVEHPQETISQDYLLTHFWHDTDADLPALSMQMNRLRAKLGDSGSALVTVRGEGYAYRY